jgi:hypothetical protein
MDDDDDDILLLLNASLFCRTLSQTVSFDHTNWREVCGGFSSNQSNLLGFKMIFPWQEKLVAPLIATHVVD